MNRLQEKYSKKIAPQLQKELKMSSLMAVPKVNKVVINMGVTQPTEPRARWQIMDNIVEQFKIITGQKPNVTLARKAIAGFTLREGDPVGAMVTLRGQQMWEFLDKLISITLPRVKDFQGVAKKAFDGHGNYNLGLEEQIVFPEINYDLINKVRGLQVTIVTSSNNDQESFRLLELLGMPFEKENNG
jgi:large subunit ribosomal protein L5